MIFSNKKQITVTDAAYTTALYVAGVVSALVDAQKTDAIKDENIFNVASMSDIAEDMYIWELLKLACAGALLSKADIFGDKIHEYTKSFIMIISGLITGNKDGIEIFKQVGGERIGRIFKGYGGSDEVDWKEFFDEAMDYAKIAKAAPDGKQDEFVAKAAIDNFRFTGFSNEQKAFAALYGFFNGVRIASNEMLEKFTITD